MLSQTTVTAIRFLIHLALLDSDSPVPPRQIAEHLGLSPTYTAKIAGTLSKANVLRSHRGALGGVTLARSPEQISLKEIVIACQGVILGDFCKVTDDLENACSFHQVVAELHSSTLDILSRWTLADLMVRPCGNNADEDGIACRMGNLVPISNVSGKSDA